MSNQTAAAATMQHYPKQRIEIYCRSCNQEIRFHKDHKTSGGKWIPLNMDVSHHDCPAKKQHQHQKTMEEATAKLRGCGKQSSDLVQGLASWSKKTEGRI
jgi:hypothetical protein